jgi:hypothetical protein
LKSVGSRLNVYEPYAGCGNAPQKRGRKICTPALKPCSPFQSGTKYETDWLIWVFISFHHCGEFVGDPRLTEGNSSRGVGEFESNRLSMREKPARTS